MQLRILVLLCAATVFGASCGSSEPPTAPSSATPSTGVPPPPAVNRAPTVRIVFEGASRCTPLPGRPCEVTVAAEATDPDGDALTYSWSGCASGSQVRSLCRVERPGGVEAAVVVSDGSGNSARASASAEGTNRGPQVTIGYLTAFSGSFELLGNVQDPEEGFLCGRQYCGSAVTTGACGPVTLNCTCLAGLEAFVMRTASAGVCTVTFTLKDSWGAEGTSSFSFDVSRPSGPASSRRR